MRTIDIEALENSLDDCIRAAEAGDTIAVTDRGRVVAEIVPPRQGLEASEEEILERGVREGWLTRAEVDWREPLPDSGPAPPDDPDVPFDVLMAELAQDREDRWSTSTAPSSSRTS